MNPLHDLSGAWTRRAWLGHHALGLAALGTAKGWQSRTVGRPLLPRGSAGRGARVVQQAARLDPTSWSALAERAVEAAQAAGAQYADARLTRRVCHMYQLPKNRQTNPGHDLPRFAYDEEVIGVGVRVLVGGYWGFAGSTVITPDEVARLAQAAVAGAKANAKGPPRAVDMGRYPVARGTWTTPIRIDPFAIAVEEKLDYLLYWRQCADDAGLALFLRDDGRLQFLREERVVATSEGARFVQTCYESGGEILVARREGGTGAMQGIPGIQGIQGIQGIALAGAGWERFLDAQIPEQCRSGQLAQTVAAKGASRPSPIGRYTLVCDGATMAALVEATLGVVTQLDRALGYEADASGTSWWDDPLAHVGHTQVTSSLVTVTANRTAPGELATVKWDEEGVEPEPFTLIKDGVLMDFQTTREQAAWLAPYYQQQGRPVRSHGCAAAQSAHVLPIQHMPNLSLEPSPSAMRLTDLVAEVPEGIFVEHGEVVKSYDAEARTGLLSGTMREITNGRLGKVLVGGQLQWDGQELWRQVKALGGPATQMSVGRSAEPSGGIRENRNFVNIFDRFQKGQPAQATSHSIRAVAATITNQPVVHG